MLTSVSSQEAANGLTRSNFPLGSLRFFCAAVLAVVAHLLVLVLVLVGVRVAQPSQVVAHVGAIQARVQSLPRPSLIQAKRPPKTLARAFVSPWSMTSPSALYPPSHRDTMAAPASKNMAAVTVAPRTAYTSTLPWWSYSGADLTYYSARELDVLAAPTVSIDVDFPQAMNGVRGEVVVRLQLWISSSGVVDDAVILAVEPPLPEVGERVKQVFEGVYYQPAEKDGKLVQSVKEIEVSFSAW